MSTLATVIDNPKPYNGRIVKQEMIFKGGELHQCYRVAQTWLGMNGYDCGSSDAMGPTAVTIGNYYKHPAGFPHKWHNFTNAQKKMVDGVITGDTRYGPIIIKLFNTY